MEMRIWILAPCYYDVQSFLELQKQTQLVMSDKFPHAKLIIVLIDDSGGQDTAVSALTPEQGVVVVSPPFNLGHQGALVFALRRLAQLFNDDDYIVTIDSDGEDRPQDIPILIAPLLAAEENLSLVSMAQRTKRKRSGAFKLMYFFFKIFFLSLTGTLVSNGNFMGYRGWFAKNVMFHPFFDYCYSSSVLTLARSKSTIPIARDSRYFGQSKMTPVSLISHGFRMLLPFSDRIAVRALILAAVLFVLTTGAVAYSVYLVLTGSSSAFMAITMAVSAVGILAVLMGTAAVVFNIFNQTMAIALRQLTFRERGLDCVTLHGIKLEELQR